MATRVLCLCFQKVPPEKLQRNRRAKRKFAEAQLAVQFIESIPGKVLLLDEDAKLSQEEKDCKIGAGKSCLKEIFQNKDMCYELLSDYDSGVDADGST